MPDILDPKLRPQACRQSLTAKGAKIAVEVVQPRFERHNLDPGRLCPFGQRHQRSRAGRIVVACDIESLQPGWKQYGGEMGCGEARDGGCGGHDLAQ